MKMSYSGPFYLFRWKKIELWYEQCVIESTAMMFKMLYHYIPFYLVNLHASVSLHGTHDIS